MLAVASVILTIAIVVAIPLGIARAVTIALAAPVAIAVSLSVAFPAMAMTRAMSALIGERRNNQMREDEDRGEEGAHNAQGRKAQDGGDQKPARLRRSPEQAGGSARYHGFGLRNSDSAARGWDELHRPKVSGRLKRMHGGRSIGAIRALSRSFRPGISLMAPCCGERGLAAHRRCQSIARWFLQPSRIQAVSMIS